MVRRASVNIFRFIDKYLGLQSTPIEMNSVFTPYCHKHCKSGGTVSWTKHRVFLLNLNMCLTELLPVCVLWWPGEDDEMSAGRCWLEKRKQKGREHNSPETFIHGWLAGLWALENNSITSSYKIKIHGNFNIPGAIVTTQEQSHIQRYGSGCVWLWWVDYSRGNRWQTVKPTEMSGFLFSTFCDWTVKH